MRRSIALVCLSTLVLTMLLSGCGGGGTTTTTTAANSSEMSAFLVESIPMTQFDAIDKLPEARYTWDVLTDYVNNATTKIDLTAMYFGYIATNKKGDQRNFTAEEFNALGAGRGAALQQALVDAAKRGVKIRVLCGSGIAPDCMHVTAELNEKYGNFVAQLYNATAWYGDGIMHQKFWVFDDNRAYLGSANSDWLSLTQVKEMGIAFDGPAGFSVVSDLQAYFDRWWHFTALDVPSPPAAGGKYSTPCWEKKDYMDHTTCENPLPTETRTMFNQDNPMALTLNGGESASFISCSPPAVCDHAVSPNPMYTQIPEGREWDGAALIHTIMSANKSVGLMVMDYKPSSGYISPTVFWPALNDALIAAVRRGCKVRMAVSHWFSNSPYWSESPRGSGKYQVNNVDEWNIYNLLQATANACTDYHCSDGSLEIGVFEIPGWDKEHSGQDSEFPLYSRVNHAKYIVTDDRFNIGTSNMDWGYFHTTAGTSFNSNHRGLRSSLQAAFDRDWESPYISPLQATEHYIPPHPDAMAAKV